MNTQAKVEARFPLLELFDSCQIKWNVHVADSLGAYDMIIGRNLLLDLGIELKFSTQTIEWDGRELPFKDAEDDPVQSYYIQDSCAVHEAATRIKHILDAKYEKADLDEVARNQTHLTHEEQQKLRQLLLRHAELLDGTLGLWKDEECDFELKEDAKPYHAKAFPIPKVHMQTLRQEVERLIKLGVLKHVNRSEWAAPTFIIPKKDGTVRFISDFRELNKRLKRRPYPIPKIQDLLAKLEGFKYATSLDLNMGYYHIELSPASKWLWMIVLLFGKYEYQRLPMGVAGSPDVFQEKMSDLMAEIKNVRCYLDDLLCLTSGTFDEHIKKLDEVMLRLRMAGLKVNV